MNQWKLKATWIASLALVSLLGVVSAVSCGGGEHATATLPATLTSTPLATATPLPTAPGQSQTAPTPASWVPPTGSAPPDATPFELPYRVIISGPDTAHPGDQVTYEIQYQCVIQAQVCDHTRLTLRLDWPKEGSLVDFSPAADAHAVSPSAMGVTFQGAGGADQATFQIADGFSGDFWLGISMTGTTKPYSWPEGTVDTVHTGVVIGPTP